MKQMKKGQDQRITECVIQGNTDQAVAIASLHTTHSIIGGADVP